MPDALVKLVVSGEKVDSCGYRRVVGCNGVREGVESCFNAVQLTLYNGIHGVSRSELCAPLTIQNRIPSLFICPSDPTNLCPVPMQDWRRVKTSKVIVDMTFDFQVLRIDRSL